MYVQFSDAFPFLILALPIFYFCSHPRPLVWRCVLSCRSGVADAARQMRQENPEVVESFQRQVFDGVASAQEQEQQSEGGQQQDQTQSPNSTQAESGNGGGTDKDGDGDDPPNSMYS